MTEQERIGTTETALRVACAEAQAQGLVLVRHVDVVTIGGVAVGCCAWGAVALTEADDAEFSDIAAPEYDAIEHGWDGAREYAERDGLPMAWYEVGERLAAEFKPVAASNLEGL